MSDPTLLGLPRTVRFRGRDYPIQHPRTFQVEAAFVLWVEREAALAVERHREAMGAQWYSEQSAGWRRDVAGKVFAWGSEACHNARWSAAGVKELAWLQLAAAQRPETPVDRELVEAMFEDAHAAQELTELVLGVVQQPKVPDPNGAKGQENPAPSPSQASA